MEESKIIILPNVQLKLDILISDLHNVKYFAIKSSAIKYVNKIYNYIENIDNQTKYHSVNQKEGKYYSKPKMNRKTAYYITFDFEEEYCIIKNFFTNHERGYIDFIKT
jgi:hypothetical protein